MRTQKTANSIKTNILKLITSQGMMDEQQAISMIRQGRIKVDNRTYFDPKHGCTIHAGTPFTIDNSKFYFYPNIYLLYNKPKDIVCSLHSSRSPSAIFPTSFLNRDPFTLQPLLSLPSNMRGITVYTDDPLLVSHTQRNMDLIGSVFEVVFMETNTINREIINTLKTGIEVRTTKNRNRFTKVNIDKMELIKDGNTINKWRITMSKYPRALYRLLRSINLKPLTIDRVAINDTINDYNLNINEWRIMHQQEIESIANYNTNSKCTQIGIDSILTSRSASVRSQLF